LNNPENSMNLNPAALMFITEACRLAEKKSVCLYAKRIDDHRDERDLLPTRQTSIIT